MQLYKLLYSKKLAFYIIIIGLTYCLVGVIEVAITGVHNTEFFFAWPMKTLLTILLINTFACTLCQAQKRWRFYKKVITTAKPLRWSQNISLKSEKEALDWLTSRGYARRGILAWAKRPYALFFILLFHSAFVFLGIGFLISNQVRAEALLPMIDGEGFLLNKEAYSLVDKRAHGELNTDEWYAHIQNVRVDYPDTGWPDVINADFQITHQEQTVLSGNLDRVTPLTYKGVQFNVWDFSYAPYIVVAREGRVIVEGYVSLMNDEINNQHVVRDEIILPDQKLMQITFLPRGKDPNWGDSNKNMRPKNPYLEIGLEGKAKQLVALNQQVTVGPYQISFADYRYMVQVKVIKDPGMPIIFWAIWLGLFGLGCHYYFPASFAFIIPNQITGGCNIHIFTWTSNPIGRYRNEQ